MAGRTGTRRAQQQADVARARVQRDISVLGDRAHERSAAVKSRVLESAVLIAGGAAVGALIGFLFVRDRDDTIE